MKSVAMKRDSTSRRRDAQGGYALLMVFLMAAIIALMLYQQLPRVAFESEREKEQLLIDRGEQYTRAIQLYYIANRQYPTSLEDLEKKEKRYLRRRFVDPFTGKDEWRIVHTNGGFLTDSLVTKPPTGPDGQSQSASNSSNTNNNPGLQDQQQPQVNAAVLQRPSDRQAAPTTGFAPGIVPGLTADQNQQQAQNGPLPPITLVSPTGQQVPSSLPPITLTPGGGGYPNGLPPITLTPGALGNQQAQISTQILNQGQFQGQIPGQVPGQIPGQIPGQVPGQVPGQAPGQIPGQVPGQIPGQVPGQPIGQGRGGIVAPFPGIPNPQTAPGGGFQPNIPPGFRIDANGQLVQIAPVPGQTPDQGIPGQPLPPQPTGFGQQNNLQTNSVPAAIGQTLQTPRQNTTSPAFSGGNQVGAIAGIASTHKGPSIKTYKDQTQYQLWEFVFNPQANTTPGAPSPGTPPTNPNISPAINTLGGPNNPGPITSQPNFGNTPKR